MCLDRILSDAEIKEEILDRLRADGLPTGAAVGLRVAGRYLAPNYAVPTPTVAERLWSVA